jgi:DNA-3-methyladenine glycosylase I
MDREDGLHDGEDGRTRCSWCMQTPEYRRYHDAEWGRPIADDRLMFEKLCLEGFMSGLSWLTILNKRENFRRGFAGFDIDAVAKFGDADVARLLGDAGIVRHKGKILSTINNARRAIELRDKEGSLAGFFWRYEADPSGRPARMDIESLRANTTSKESMALSKDLKKRGWSFVGPTTVYSFMQALGLVNDHIEGCHIRAEVEAVRAGFKRPG